MTDKKSGVERLRKFSLDIAATERHKNVKSEIVSHLASGDYPSMPIWKFVRDLANQIESEHAAELAELTENRRALINEIERSHAASANHKHEVKKAKKTIRDMERAAQRDLTDEARAVVERFRGLDYGKPQMDMYELVFGENTPLNAKNRELNEWIFNRLCELIEHGSKQDVDVASLLEVAAKLDERAYYGSLEAESAERIRKAVEGAPKPNPYAMIAEDMGMDEGSIRACLAWYKTNQSNIDVAVARDVAADWVEQQGGLNVVQNNMLPEGLSGFDFTACMLDIAKYADIEYDCNDVYGFIESLIPELATRLMPPGMEWPRFEDGKLVEFGSVVDGIDGSCEKFIFTRSVGGVCQLQDACGCRVNMLNGERVKHPEPEALGADGKPIKVGETLYRVSTGERLVVAEIENEHTVHNETLEGLPVAFRADQLTHTPPDTQERIDEDVRLNPREYWKTHRKKGQKEDRLLAQKIDLLRRQRELDIKTAGGAQ